MTFLNNNQGPAPEALRFSVTPGGNTKITRVPRERYEFRLPVLPSTQARLAARNQSRYNISTPAYGPAILSPQAASAAQGIRRNPYLMDAQAPPNVTPHLPYVQTASSLLEIADRGPAMRQDVSGMSFYTNI